MAVSFIFPLLFIGRVLIEVENTHGTHSNFKNYWFAFAFVFIFFLSSYSNVEKRKELCAFAFEIIHDQFIH